jgi:hypothetical protein
VLLPLRSSVLQSSQASYCARGFGQQPYTTLAATGTPGGLPPGAHRPTTTPMIPDRLRTRAYSPSPSKQDSTALLAHKWRRCKWATFLAACPYKRYSTALSAMIQYFTQVKYIPTSGWVWTSVLRLASNGTLQQNPSQI